MSGTVTGMHKSVHRGSSVEFAEYRKYVPGDDIRHIDWRVFGRTDRFYMKEFEAETNLRCYLVVDTSASMGFGAGEENKFDFARRMAATLAYPLMQQGDAVGLTAFAGRRRRDLPPRYTPSHLRNIFDVLGQLAPHGPTDIVGALHDLAERIHRRSLVLIFSDFFTDIEPLLDCFQHLRFRKHDVGVFHLLGRQELQFGFDRPIRFADMESSFAQVTDPAVIRGAYLRALHEYLDGLRRGCMEFRVDYQRIVTDGSYEKALVAFMLQRMNRAAG